VGTSKPVESIKVPGYSGKSISVKAGQYIRITDIEGEQVGDLFALSAKDHYEYLSPSVTRLNNLTIFPRTGEQFYSNKDRPILTFIEDRSAGPHDMLFASCNNAFFEAWGESSHSNCRDNYFKAAAAAGIEHKTKPDPVNLFQNTPVNPDGSISAFTTRTSAGDYVVLLAEMDIILILTACSVDQINGGKSTPLMIEIFDDLPAQIFHST
jgi:uncharacterized protein YcgI (DUF1989 family)